VVLQRQPREQQQQQLPSPNVAWGALLVAASAQLQLRCLQVPVQA
jgi:hypothetical protein